MKDGSKLLKKLKKTNPKNQRRVEQVAIVQCLGGAMLRITDLLNKKNHFLEKFYSINEAELVNFSKGNFDNLEGFYRNRENILSLIRYLDEQIELLKNDPTIVMNDPGRKEVSQAFAVKEEYVNRILAQDLEILSCIEHAKSNIIRELQEIRRTKRVVGSYKSKTFTNRLDEEA
jgi:predicted metal-dependent hydrolase